MTLQDIKKIKTFLTRGIGADFEENLENRLYISDCVNRMYNGDYGTMPAEDIEQNNRELEDGIGRIVCRYEKKGTLTNDFYIIASFNENMPLEELDYNNIMVMYVDEY